MNPLKLVLKTTMMLPIIMLTVEFSCLPYYSLHFNMDKY